MQLTIALGLMTILTGCAEPLVISSFDSKMGVNWLIRPSPHRGVDYPAPVGTPVLAAMKGVVSNVYLNPKVGWIVRIQHPTQNWDTRYLHLHTSAVKKGEVVERGQRIGTVGLYEFSAGVEHVHLELYSTPSNRKEVRDPMAVMAGCYDKSKQRSHPKNLLTIPIPCEPSFFNATRPIESKWTTADIQAEVSTGLDTSVGMRTRGIVPTSLGTQRLKLFGAWDLGAGVSSNANFTYDTRLLTGPGIAHGLFDLGILTGIGVSKGDSLEQGVSIPAMVFWRIKQRRFWGRFWARTSWLLDAPSRQEGSSLTSLGIDELAVGAQMRIPPLTRHALVFSLEYREVRKEQQFVLGVGFSFDSLF